MISRELLSRIRKIEIRTRRMVEEVTAGAYHSVFKGSGIEFDEVREYTYDDDVRNIDWNVTAKMGHPFVKKYIEERELNVMLLVDISPSQYYGSGKKTKIETAMEIASILAFSANKNNDKVGGLMFTNQKELYLPPKSGRQHSLRLIRELLARKPEGQRTDISFALDYVMRLLHKKSVIFLISDFVSEKDYEKLLNVANKRHDVIGIRVLDENEIDFPQVKGINFLDIETKEESFFSGKKKEIESLKENVKAFHNKNKQICNNAKVDFIDVRCDDDLIKPLMSFFRKREKLLQRGQ